MENKAGHYTVPSFESTTAAMAAAELPDNLRFFLPDPEGPESCPIVTLTWVPLHRNYDDRKKAEGIRELFRWCLYEGQRFSCDLGYIPLAPRIVVKAVAALDTVAP